MKKNVLIKISTLLICSIILSSCSAIFPTQKMIDSILKKNNQHAYSIADLIPFNENELKNARSLYGMELNDYYNNNINAGLEGKELEEFNSNLIYMDYNYNILMNRYNMYTENEESYNKCKEEFDDYYKLKDTKAKDVIKSTNNGSLSGAPNISIKIDMTTLEDHGIYSEAEADIFNQIVIKENDYKKLKLGDTIKINVPATNSTVNAKVVVPKVFTYIATNSISYKETNENGLTKDTTYFIAPLDVLNNSRKIVDVNGNVLEVYNKREKLQFMKYALVVKGSSPDRFYQSMISNNFSTKNYYMNDLAIKAQTGGYLVEEYKDELYANTVYTNLKGYITQCLYFSNLNYDNEYTNEYREILSDERTEQIKYQERIREEENERRIREQNEMMEKQQKRIENISKIYDALSLATSSEIIKNMINEYELTEEEVFGQTGFVDSMFNLVSTQSEPVIND